MPHTTRRMIELLDRTYEFDRQPVSPDRLHSGRYFAGLFAGEHVAATEFVIGALFVSWGAAAADILFGLLIGNLLAVLSWTFVTAPISVQTRLTLYWYLRKIAGPVVTLIYNILNAVLYCILAGAMITVAASAVRIPFNIPPQTDWLPDDIRFVLIVLFVGAVVVTFAILGFRRVSLFASVCSPWMFIMFAAGAFVALPVVAASIPEIGRIGSLSDFWSLANKAIWTGESSAEVTPIGFWHLAAFAWITNLAMHLGLSDMAVFRYARRSSYGLYSAFGMFLGHYVAWIAAGIMGAAAAIALNQPLIELDSGAVAFNALGVSGAIAVVIAGWTTSNPTLYRAGLALQAVTPNWPRWLVTLIAGSITTLIACSPFVFTKLLSFVGIYGLLLVPIGAIVAVEHWIFPKIGLRRYWASQKGVLLSWPALSTWIFVILLAVALWRANILHLFFLFIPVGLSSAILYTALAWIGGARKPPVSTAGSEKDEGGKGGARPENMRRAKDSPVGGPSPARNAQLWAMGVIALISLILCLILPFRVFMMGIDGYVDQLASMKTTLLWGSLAYFVSATLWMVQHERRRGQIERST